MGSGVETGDARAPRGSRPSRGSSSRSWKATGSSRWRCSTRAGHAQWPPAELEAAVSGATIEGLGRRGKYLLLGLDGGRTLVMHLRMTGNLVLKEGEEILDPSEGRLLYQGERTTEARYLRARFVLDDGRELWFTDPRRFGEAFLIDDADLPARFAKLGVEAALGRVHPRAAGRGRGRAEGAAEVVPARPSRGSRASATSTPTRRSTGQDCTRSRRRGR